jgi:hypothetical protein
MKNKNDIEIGVWGLPNTFPPLEQEHVNNFSDILRGTEFLQCNYPNEITSLSNEGFVCIPRPKVKDCLNVMSGIGQCSKCVDGRQLVVKWPNGSQPIFSCAPFCQIDEYITVDDTC